MKASIKAFSSTAKTLFESFNAVVPIRPVILGGDDTTIILAAPYALDFAEAYVKSFESETQGLFGRDEPGIQCTAGIAFIKEKYPIHLAVDHANRICKFSKSELARNGVSTSCFSAHKVDEVDYEKGKYHTRIYSFGINGDNHYLGHIEDFRELLNCVLSKSISVKSLYEVERVLNGESVTSEELHISLNKGVIAKRLGKFNPGYVEIFGKDWHLNSNTISLISDFNYLRKCLIQGNDD